MPLRKERLNQTVGDESYTVGKLSADVASSWNGLSCSSKNRLYTQTLFYARCFTPFCFNAPCQFTPLLNLRSLIFGLTLLGWLHSITLTPYFWWGYHFWFTPFLFMPIFSRTQLGRKTRVGIIIYKVAVFFLINNKDISFFLTWRHVCKKDIKEDWIKNHWEK
jgi:hypothetical protein